MSLYRNIIPLKCIIIKNNLPPGAIKLKKLTEAVILLIDMLTKID